MLPELLGCYQSQKLEKMGKTAGSGRDFTQRINWLAMRLDAARILIFPLNDKNLPMPLQKTVTPQEFLGHFLPAPLVFKEQLAPAALVLGRLLGGSGGTAIDQNALPEAERALFTVILVALSAGGHDDSDGAVLAVLTGSGATSGGDAQKRTINAFGIELRKQKDFETAAAYYRTALELAPGDERLMFNLARVLYEQGELAGCRDLLEKAVAADPDFSEARKFLRHVRRREGVLSEVEFPDISL
ncbi:tetratricopeptide repeat protein [Solidesulfovibrio sp.]|uniref:tetratricopeptide repeat protein n=1 Tax=Solidesulfovibrio sp. TaxID=2910990 RepID=UPI00261DAE5E|nr:tetratricopeptide repeat protein [Solidesulfovibrio sp.]